MKKDILKVISGVIFLGAVMDLVFLAIGRFDITVLWGTLLGIVCAILNFVFLAITVSMSLSKGKSASGYMGVSYLLRLAFIGVVIVFAIRSPYINYVATAIPLVFPRIVIITLQGVLNRTKKVADKEGDNLGGS
ncbi:MAG: hypothetical protein E7416_02120 [Ruminococcaceae bacterium]|nr:hypothetical protein [Oscillospiraceae bacterium]